MRPHDMDSMIIEMTPTLADSNVLVGRYRRADGTVGVAAARDIERLPPTMLEVVEIDASTTRGAIHMFRLGKGIE